jgi:hypothetical protein
MAAVPYHRLHFLRKAGNVGRRGTHILKPTPKILLSHASFSREKKGGGESQ